MCKQSSVNQGYLSVFHPDLLMVSDGFKVTDKSNDKLDGKLLVNLVQVS